MIQHACIAARRKCAALPQVLVLVVRDDESEAHARAAPSGQGDLELFAARVEHELRRQRIRAEVRSTTKLKKQLHKASAEGVQAVAIIGTSELAHSSVLLKDFRSGQQELVERSRLAVHLQLLGLA